MSGPELTVVLVVLGVLIYFIPGMTASYRKHPQEKPIIIINLFLGWTFLGWIIALAWAMSGPGGKKSEQKNP